MRLEPLGQFAKINENIPPLNYYCEGFQASEVNVFIIPGSDSVFLPYGQLITLLSQDYRVCTYDRHGRMFRYVKSHHIDLVSYHFSGGKANNTNAEFNIDALDKVINAGSKMIRCSYIFSFWTRKRSYFDCTLFRRSSCCFVCTSTSKACLQSCTFRISRNFFKGISGQTSRRIHRNSQLDTHYEYYWSYQRAHIL